LPLEVVLIKQHPAFGIPAIVLAAQANVRLGAGNATDALEASKKARL